jgi:hypothetical protein
MRTVARACLVNISSLAASCSYKRIVVGQRRHVQSTPAGHTVLYVQNGFPAVFHQLCHCIRNTVFVAEMRVEGVIFN